MEETHNVEYKRQWRDEWLQWICGFANAQGGISSISQKSWIFLILSGLATGASWLCYYKALQIGEASKVVPIDKLSIIFTIVLAVLVLHETVTTKAMVGCAFIAMGTLMMVL